MYLVNFEENYHSSSFQRVSSIFQVCVCVCVGGGGGPPIAYSP